MHFRIAIIIPFFGELNNYFELWLHSAGYNREFDFWLFTDDKRASKCAVPENVNLVFMKFDDVRDMVSTILNYKFVLHKPYKLCDYKPLYGLIFKKYIEGYDFWGHCDVDIIWGNLGKFITDDILEKYDRIYRSGHLCLYRNCEYMNNLVINMECENRRGVSPKDVYTHKYSAHFDENYLIDNFLNDKGILTYRKIDCADVWWRKKNFVCINNEADTVLGFKFERGELLGYLEDNSGNISKKEYSYIHLQKRNMQGNILNKDCFWIVSNEFQEYGCIENLACLKGYGVPSIEYERSMTKIYRQRQIQNIMDGALLFRIKSIGKNES